MTDPRPAAPRGCRTVGLAVLVGMAVLVGGPGPATSAPAGEKADVDQRLERARERLERERAHESVLTDEVQGYTDRIRTLEARLAPLRARSEHLDSELAVVRERLRALTGRLKVEKARLQEAGRRWRAARNCCHGASVSSTCAAPRIRS